MFKVLRIQFGSDGSIYVQFPYCTAKTGVLAELPIEEGIQGPVTYNLGELGVRVTTDVKFSHHRSGMALFSRTGMDINSPRRRSFPLDGPIGHVFRLQLHRLDGFQQLTKLDKRTIYLAFDYPANVTEAIVVSGEWRRKNDIVANIEPPGGITGPGTRIMSRATGAVSSVYFLCQPDDSPLQAHVLMLSGAPTPLPSGADRSGMIFMGGWDVHEHRYGEPEVGSRGCLAFLYPAFDRPAA